MKYALGLLFLTMPFYSSASIEKDACKAKENLRNLMNVISSNIANLNTTRTPEGGPYRIKEFVCNEKACEVKEVPRTLTKYEPHHPDANEEGYVSYPDINLEQQMESMIQANRDYEDAARACK